MPARSKWQRPARSSPSTSTARREAADEAVEAKEAHRETERSRVDMMRGYAETQACRREFLLNYFGEAYEPPCDRCDNCEAGHVVEQAHDLPFELGARVTHGRWGTGVVQRYEADKLVVLFDEVGYKTLALDLVRERGLLEAEAGDRPPVA